MKRAQHVFMVISLIAAALAAPAAAEDAAESVGVVRLRAFCEAVSSADPAHHLSFFKEHAATLGPDEKPIEERAGIISDISRHTGGLRIHSITHDTPEQVMALAQQVSDQSWVRVTLEIAPEPPRTIAGLGLMPAAPPVDPDAPPLSREELVAAVIELVDGLAAADEFSGAVLIAEEDTLLLERAWGLADRRWGIANRVDSKFNLGSMNKMFTAVAIAQLAEQGKLGFDDPLGMYLEGFPTAATADKVTLHHLLTHTSGMGSYWKPLFDTNFTTIRSHEQLLDLLAGEEPDLEPGERFRYSNSGYAVLGRVIEKVTGTDYFEHVRKRVFEPAGMASTDSWAYDEPVANLATGYTRFGAGPGQEGPLRSNVFLHPPKGCAAGGGYSTVGDLHRFARALQGSTLLKPETRDRMIEPKVPSRPGSHYGYGFVIRGEGRTRSFGHSGGAPGINGELRIYPELGFVVTVLANVDHGAALVTLRIDALLERLEE